jgi:hypothetical protein
MDQRSKGILAVRKVMLTYGHFGRLRKIIGGMLSKIESTMIGKKMIGMGMGIVVIFSSKVKSKNNKTKTKYQKADISTMNPHTKTLSKDPNPASRSTASQYNFCSNKNVKFLKPSEGGT